MVTLSSPQWVKSNWASRPGGCSWGKYTSRSGPCSARLLSLSKGLQSSLQRPQLGRAEPPGMLLG